MKKLLALLVISAAAAQAQPALPPHFGWGTESNDTSDVVNMRTVDLKGQSMSASFNKAHRALFIGKKTDRDSERAYEKQYKGFFSVLRKKVMSFKDGHKEEHYEIQSADGRKSWINAKWLDLIEAGKTGGYVDEDAEHFNGTVPGGNNPGGGAGTPGGAVPAGASPTNGK